MPSSGQGHQVQADSSGESHPSISEVLQVKTCPSTQLEIVSGARGRDAPPHAHLYMQVLMCICALLRCYSPFTRTAKPGQAQFALARLFANVGLNCKF